MAAMKPFLILQLRPIDAVADNEYQAFLQYGGLRAEETVRVRMEKESFGHLDVQQFSGVIMGGGPSNVSDAENDKPDFQRRFEAEANQLYDQIFALDYPYLGSCYGLGSVIKYAGGTVSQEQYGEKVGCVTIRLQEAAQDDPLLQGFPATFPAFTGHKEASQFVPEGGILLASSEGCPVHMVRFQTNIYATQFHTELDKKGIALRIQYYKNHGYFAPDMAEALITELKDVHTAAPQLILRRFVERYRQLS
jgi:GMP synthase (glutamine-hydrolysing)